MVWLRLRLGRQKYMWGWQKRRREKGKWKIQWWERKRKERKERGEKRDMMRWRGTTRLRWRAG